MLLSLMVTVGGAGFVIVKCCCKGNMAKAECRSKCRTRHGKHNIAAKPCAKTIVMKLWPSATGLQKPSCVPDAPAMMLPPYQAVMYGHTPVTAYFISRYATRLLHAPPRLYLAMISVLII